MPAGTWVLLVDDDAQVRSALMGALAPTGRRVREAGSLVEAREAVRDDAPGLVILDMFLPDGDGRDFLTELKSRASTAAAPVVMLGAVAGEAPRADAYARGAHIVFEKPLDVASVGAAAVGLLGRPVAREQREDPETGVPNRAALHDRFAALGGEPACVAMASFASPSDVVALAAAVGARGMVARWAGDHVALLLPGATPDDAVALCREARSQQGLAMDFGVSPVAVGVTLEEAVADALGGLVRAQASGGGVARTATDPLPEPVRRIVVVEDDDLSAAIVVHRLQREGFEVTRHATGTAALQGLGGPVPALVLLDVKLPGADGFTVLRELRARQAWARVPVAMLTSLGAEADVVRGLDLGADDYILKPFSPRELVARVVRLLRRP